jgi:hypothetical protein
VKEMEEEDEKLRKMQDELESSQDVGGKWIFNQDGALIDALTQYLVILRYSFTSSR